jgi:hypothetical protein
MKDGRKKRTIDTESIRPSLESREHGGTNCRHTDNRNDSDDQLGSSVRAVRLVKINDRFREIFELSDFARSRFQTSEDPPFLLLVALL